MSLSLLHDVTPGDKIPDEIVVVVEISRGSKNKYEIDHATGLMKLDRVMHSGQDYPFDYGFIPQTLWYDGDPLDVVLLTTYPLISGVLINVRPVAIIDMIDSGKGDAKILAVPTADPRFKDVKDLSDVNPHTVEEIVHFFKTYKAIQKKIVTIDGVRGVEGAKKAINEALAMYRDLPKNITK